MSIWHFPIYLLAALLISFGFAEQAEAAPSDRPNVLLIVSEDNGPELGCYGDSVARTPMLDQLSSEGARFERAYVTQAGCSQSRASILTGLYPHQHGQMGLATHGFRLFDPQTPNLIRSLAESGYRTGVIGKIHVTPESAFGFDYHRNAKYNRFGRRDVTAVADEAAAFMAESKRPFFLMVNFADAHRPWLDQQAGLPEQVHTASDVKPLPYVGIATDAMLEQTASYYNCLSRLDRGVGELLERLDESGLTDRTLVIYLGDHGAQMPRGKKTSYEGGLRIPLLMRWPGHIDRGTVRSQLISTVDLMPTILDACGVDAPSGLAGRSLMPLLQDANQPWRRYLFAEFTLHWPLTYYPSRTVRDERYKLIANLLPDRKNPVAQLYRDENKGGPTWSESMSAEEFPAARRAAYARFLQPPAVELYDLANDPHEWVNLADDPMLSDVRSRLEEELTAWQERTGDALRHPQILAQFTREVDATIVDGEYRHVGPDHPWKYPQYLDSEQP